MMYKLTIKLMIISFLVLSGTEMVQAFEGAADLGVQSNAPAADFEGDSKFYINPYENY